MTYGASNYIGGKPMTRRIIQLIILMGGLLSTSGAWATNYYIDWVNGSDINNGITRSTPWKHAPGMNGCANNCLAYQTAHSDPMGTNGAGDQFILKGGVTWPNAALSWVWTYGSGTEANPIYFGVDQTWYIGGTWTRPILDSQGYPPTPAQGFTGMVLIYAYWFIVDNIEFTGFPQLNNSYTSIFQLGTSGSAKAEVKNCYFHGWSHGETATFDGTKILSSALLTGAPDMSLRIHDNVWDGSDTTRDMAIAYQGSAGHFYNNYIAYVANGILSSNIPYVWGNTFHNIATGKTTNPSCAGYFSFDCTSHGNSIYTTRGSSKIFNNYIVNVGGGVTIWVDPADNNTAYVFNNVTVEDTNQSLSVSNYEMVTGVNTGVYVFNNTFQEVTGGSLSGPTFANKPYMTAATFRNNHEIAPNHDVIQNRVTTLTADHNLGMTSGEATSANYVSTSTSPFYPPDGGATVGAGMDLRSLAAGIPSTTISDAAAAALSDSTCGVKYDATNHRVIGPNRTPIVRGTNWDVGAYQFTGSQLSPPVLRVP
jgi:hypothetical protein